MGHSHSIDPAIKPARKHVREAVTQISRTAAVRHHNEFQAEIFDLRTFTSALLMALANVILGEDSEQRQGIASLLDMIDSDPRIARRMISILEANPAFAKKAPELMERAKRASCAGFRIQG